MAAAILLPAFGLAAFLGYVFYGSGF